MEALQTGSGRAGESAATLPVRVHAAAWARVRTGTLVLAAGLCAALPIIVATVHALHEGWQPVADRGIIALRAFDVFSTHMPLVGQYSFASAITGKLTYSLGPMLYWVLAPAAHVGAPASLILTIAAINVASVLGAVALAHRRGGVWLMLGAALGIALMCRSLEAINFYEIWNPSAALFPLLLLAFLSWSLACGEYRLLPVTLLVASFCVQCEDGFLPPAVCLAAVGVGGLTILYLRRGRRRGWKLPRGPLLILAASFAVVAICWTPTIADQLAGHGNLGNVITAASGQKHSLGASVANDAVVRTVGVRPWWLIRPSYQFSRKYEVRRPAASSTVISALAILVWLLLAFALSIRRGRVDVAAGAATALAFCAGVWLVASDTPAHPAFLAETLGYTLWSATTAGMFTWLMVLFSAVVLSRAGSGLVRAGRSLGQRSSLVGSLRAPVLVLGALLAVALAALAGSYSAGADTPDEHAFEFAALKRINAHLGAVPRGSSVYLNARLDGLITPLRPEVAYDLRRRGVRPLGTGAYLRDGHWYELSEHRYDYVVWMYDNRHLPAADAHVIASGRIYMNGRWHTVYVAISPVHRAPAPAPGRRASRRR